MCKKSKHRQNQNQLTQPRPVRVADKTGDELTVFPAECHVITGRQREVPNLAVAIANTTVRDDLQSAKRRPWDAPMATRIGAMPDPLASMAWDAVVSDAAKTAEQWWGKWQFTVALAAWSAACFILGTLA